jgi:hypothetical protein
MSLAPVSGQTPKPAVPPTAVPTEAVTLRGCIEGATLVTLETPRTTDEPERLGDVYRLRGPRALVRQLQREHDHHEEEVTGIIRVPLPVSPGGPHQKKMGKTTVTVEDGKVARPAGEMKASDLQASIEVTSFRHLSWECRR